MILSDILDRIYDDCSEATQGNDRLVSPKALKFVNDAYIDAATKGKCFRRQSIVAAVHGNSRDSSLRSE